MTTPRIAGGLGRDRPSRSARVQAAYGRRRTRSAVVAIGMAAGLVAGCGSADAEPAPQSVTKTIEIIATEYAFSGDPSVVISVGDTVRFVVRNEGGLVHELQLLDTDARLIDRTPRLEPGTSGEITATFESAGVYQVICDIDDHLSRGQRASFTVG